MLKYIYPMIFCGCVWLPATTKAQESKEKPPQSEVTSNPFTGESLRRDERKRAIEEEQSKTKLLQEKREQKRAELDIAEIEWKMKQGFSARDRLMDLPNNLPQSKSKPPAKQAKKEPEAMREKSVPTQANTIETPKPVLVAIIEDSQKTKLGIWSDGKGGSFTKNVSPDTELKVGQGKFTTLEVVDEYRTAQKKASEENLKRIKALSESPPPNSIPFPLPARPSGMRLD